MIGAEVDSADVKLGVSSDRFRSVEDQISRVDVRFEGTTSAEVGAQLLEDMSLASMSVSSIIKSSISLARLRFVDDLTATRFFRVDVDFVGVSCSVNSELELLALRFRLTEDRDAIFVCRFDGVIGAEAGSSSVDSKVRLSAVCFRCAED